MAVAIFPNSSYFIAYGSLPVFFEEIRSASLRHRARIYACRSHSEFLEALSVIQVPTGLFLDCNGGTESDYQELASAVAGLKLSPVCFFLEKAFTSSAANPKAHSVFVQSDTKPEVWRSEIDQFINRLVPPKLDQMVLDSANTIIPTFFNDIKEFKTAPYPMEGADYVLNFSVSAGDVIGQFLAWIKWNEICKMFPDLPADRSNEKILDLLRESMNQCAGQLVQSVTRMHPDCMMRVGLPTAFDLTKIPKIESVKYFPSAHLIETQGRIGISVGLIHVRNQPIFDFSAYAPAKHDGDVEFL